MGGGGGNNEVIKRDGIFLSCKRKVIITNQSILGNTPLQKLYKTLLQNHTWNHMVTCEIRLITCENHVITCEIHVITCEIHVITRETHVVICKIHVITCEIHVITCEIHVITCHAGFLQWCCIPFFLHFSFFHLSLKFFAIFGLSLLFHLRTHVVF